MSPPLLVEDKDGALSLALNRPQQKNALSRALLGKLQAALTGGLDDGSHAVIISGRGDCFSAGADLNELSGTLEDREIDDAINGVIDGIRTVPVPVIALIEGACIGGAVDIALACDFRVATDNAWFQVPATRLGLLYNPDAVARLSRLFPRDVLNRLLVLGECFDAGAAMNAGLVTHRAGTQPGAENARELVRLAAANGKRAVAATRTLLDDLYSGHYDPEYWQSRRDEILSSRERREAITKAKNR